MKEKIENVIKFIEGYVIECPITAGCGRCNEARQHVAALKEGLKDVNQEVEKRIAEVLPTKNEIGNACQLFDKQKRPLWKEAIWRAGANWVVDLIRFRLSQKTEGGVE